MSALQAVSFDAHGTIILPEPSIGGIYAEVASNHGIVRGADELDAAFVPAFRSVAATWRIPYGSSESDAQAFWHAVIDRTFNGAATPALQQQLFTEFGRGARWRLLPHVKQAIRILRDRGLNIVICSNFDRRVDTILNDLHIDRDHTFTSAEVGVAKPNPALLNHACQQLSIRPDELLHIGDNPKEDAPAARDCGCQYLEVTRGAGIDIEALTALLAQ